MKTGWLAPILGLMAAPALAQTPPVQSPPTQQKPATPPLVQVIIRAQGTADRFATTTSFVCEEGRFCTAVFDVQRRQAAPPSQPPAPGTPPRAEGRPAPTPPARVEIGVWSRPDGEVTFVALTAGQKLMLNCKASQTVTTKGRGTPPRIRYSVHEPDPGCGSGLERAPAEKAVAAVEVLVRPATLQPGQGI
ncbi:hypothetical protein [uncultured Alsobacter sp.]|uniref:hypothetical protein n=1 Tax=uncultured Alsobacter sp. TaxID=1748258 RepID=UPI0025DC70CD|nr:hypothetical protein [uncultured Alsobacter sp.]